MCIPSPDITHLYIVTRFVYRVIHIGITILSVLLAKLYILMFSLCYLSGVMVEMSCRYDVCVPLSLMYDWLEYVITCQ